MASMAVSTNLRKMFKICRLCLSEESLGDIFMEEDLRQWISDFLLITVSAEDRMSQAICAICRIRLNEMHQFRISCQKVQGVLQSMIRDVSDEAKKGFSKHEGSQHLDKNTVFHLAPILYDHGKTKLSDRHAVSELQTVKTEPSEVDDFVMDTQEQTNGLESRVYAESSPESAIHRNAKLQNIPSNRKSVSVNLQSSMVQNLDGENDTANGEQSVEFEDMIDIEDVKIETYTDEEESVLSDKPPEVGTQQDTVPTQKASNRDVIVNGNATTDYVDDKYSCLKCNQTFSRQSQLKSHMTAHDANFNDNQPTDSDDEETGTAKADSDNSAHFATTDQPCQTVTGTADGQKLKCPKCDKMFRNAKTLTHHQRYHKPKTLECPICKKPFLNRFVLNRHIPIHDPISERQHVKPVVRKKYTEKRFNCEICQKAFTNEFAVTWHKRQVHGPKIHGCHICGAKFTMPYALARHVRRHSLESEVVRSPSKQATNAETATISTNAQSSKSDKEKNPNAAAIKCAKCDETCSSNLELRQHFKLSHKRKHQCPKCKTEFASRKFLETHLATQHKQADDDEQSLQCNVCNKVFRNSILRRRHNKIHEPKIYSCMGCEKTFRNTTLLKSHLQLLKSDGESFYCAPCNKTISTFEQKIAHLAHAPKIHQCNMCSQKYSMRTCLLNHMKTHKEYQTSKKLIAFRDSSSTSASSEYDSENSFPEDTSEDEQTDQSSTGSDWSQRVSRTTKRTNGRSKRQHTESPGLNQPTTGTARRRSSRRRES